MNKYSRFLTLVARGAAGFLFGVVAYVVYIILYYMIWVMVKIA